VLVGYIELIHGVAKFFSHVKGSFQLRIGQQTDKLLAAVTRRQITASRQTPLDSARHPPQAIISGGMPIVVVKRLEKIDIHHHQRQGQRKPQTPSPLLIQGLIEPTPVSDLRKAVKRGEAFQQIILALEVQMGSHPGLNNRSLKRLGDVVDRAQAEALQLILELTPGRDKNHRDIPGAIVSFERPADGVAIHPGHHDI